jgi:predicted transcriptional regulator
MTITINLPPATLAQLQAEAQTTGKDVESIIRDAVESRLARRQRTFAEILKPIHDEVEASGIGEKELEALVDQAVADARAEQTASEAR